MRFIQAVQSVVNSTWISPYSCKYSKKIYTQHQFLVLVLFKDYAGLQGVSREQPDKRGDFE
jgi:hypothetical protein